MPTLFISYKRGTSSIPPVLDRLRAAHYRLWFDRDDIHLGDPDWQAKIDQGLIRCGGVILGLSPLACQSIPVQYEIRKARELGKPIFPLLLELLPDITAGLKEIGLPERQHVEDLTTVAKFEENFPKLLKGLVMQGLAVTRHDLRAERGEKGYRLHQDYLNGLVRRVGRLQLSVISEGSADGAALEDIYVSLPTTESISVEVQDYQIVDWWVRSGYYLTDDDGYKLMDDDGNFLIDSSRIHATDLGWETASLELLIDSLQETYAARKCEVREQEEKGELFIYNWIEDGEKENAIPLDAIHIAAACDRLVILGGPGSGKSTFVKHLALCLAAQQLDASPRKAGLQELPQWTHGTLTPIYVELRHFVASAHFPKDINTKPSADHLWSYIKAEILGTSLAEYAADLHEDLREGYAIIILDGLDEVPFPRGKDQLRKRQEQLRALAQDIEDTYPKARLLVASRPYAYEGWTLPNFQSVQLAAFDDNDRRSLATNLYLESRDSEEIANDKAGRLVAALQPIDPELKDRPLFITLMASIFASGEAEGLPTRPGALYRESIMLLLKRWTTTKPDAPSLATLLGNASDTDLLNKLAHLAYEVHDQLGGQSGTPEIPLGLISQHIFAMELEDPTIQARGLVVYLSENAGVLVSPGDKAGLHVFHFAHRTFQEYLAARHIAQVCSQTKAYHLVRELIESRPQLWRVAASLVGDVLTDAQEEDPYRAQDIWQLLEDLLPDEPPEPALPAQHSHWWAVWLASELFRAQGFHQLEKLRRGEAAFKASLVAWLVALTQTPQALAPVERAACGRVLSLLSDPRKGVGVIVRNGVKFPEIEWCEIPSGEFLFGEGKTQQALSLPTFYMAKYPITYAQFHCFLEDADGFRNSEWWEGLRIPDGHNTQLGDQAFKFGNHPRERVSWYEAMAFCRWSSYKLGGKYGLGEVADWKIRLPTEAEWEKAARGTTGLIYPYGNEFDASKGNTDETGIGQTSAVGLFPQGASPYGVMEMSGNIWEWTLTEYNNGQSDDLSNSNSQVLRGGSWYNFGSLARAAYRSRNDPYGRSNNIGFRVVCPSALY